MTDTEPSSPQHPIGIDTDDPLHVDLYVRPNVSAVSRRQVDALQHRLRRLAETPLVADRQSNEWPPYQSPPESDGDTGPQREELVCKFENWAEESGVSLRPAFRRQTVPSSLVDSREPHRAVRVPIVTLALYADGTDLQGVVPYTTDYGTEDAETFTVDDWLTAVEEESEAAVAQPHSSRQNSYV